MLRIARKYEFCQKKSIYLVLCKKNYTFYIYIYIYKKLKAFYCVSSAWYMNSSELLPIVDKNRFLITVNINETELEKENPRQRSIQRSKGLNMERPVKGRCSCASTQRHIIIMVSLHDTVFHYRATQGINLWNASYKSANVTSLTFLVF